MPKWNVFAVVTLCVSAASIPSGTIAQTSNVAATEAATPTIEIDEIAVLKKAVDIAAKAAETATHEAEIASQAQAETLAEAETAMLKAEEALIAEQEANAKAETANSEASRAANNEEFKIKVREALMAEKAATAASELAIELKETAEIYALAAERQIEIARGKADAAETATQEVAAAEAAVGEAMENAQAIAAVDTTETAESSAATNQEIELRSPDGLVSVTGTIVDYDANLITIKTSYGVVGIPRDGIECFGSTCPPETLAAQ